MVSLMQAALNRLRDQAATDAAEPWHPGKQPTDAMCLWKYIRRIEDECSLAKDDAFLRGYNTHEAELEALERGRQGVFG